MSSHYVHRVFQQLRVAKVEVDKYRPCFCLFTEKEIMENLIIQFQQNPISVE